MTTTLYLDVTRAAHETVAKILARRSGVRGGAYRLTMTAKGGSTASVEVSGNDVVLNMPTMPADALLARHEADRLVGFVAHECLHVLHTDWNAWRAAVRHGPRVRLWANALEDVRIEAREIRAGHFPALRGLLGALMDHMHYKALTGLTDGRVIGAEIADAPYVSAVMGRLGNKYDVPSARNLRRDMSPAVRALVEHATREVKTCRDTWGVLRLAQALVAMEQATATPPAPDQTPPDQSGQGDDSQDDQSGDSQDSQDDQSGQGDDSQDDQSGDSQDSQDDQSGQGDDSQDDQSGQGDDSQDDQSGQGDDSQDDQSGQGTAPGDGHGDGSDSDADALDPSATLEDMVQGIRKRNGDAPDATGSGLHGWSTTHKDYSTQSLNRASTAGVFNRALPGRAILHGQISRLLVSEERTWTTHRETSGRIDRRAMARLGTGAPDVFSQRHYRPGLDTALAVLIDLSGSMSGDRIEIAKVAAFHIAAAAEDAGATVGVFGFLTNGGDYNLTADVRLARAIIVDLIPFGMSVRGNCDRIAAVSPTLTTPLSPAILGVAEALGAQPAARHILMVLTDGDCDFGNVAVTQACHVAASWGVETVGVGIAAPAVVKAFPDGHSVNVEHLAALGATGLGVLASMLEEAAEA